MKNMEQPSSSFEMLVGANMTRLHAYASHYTKNEDDAADLVQDTLMKAFNYFHHFIPGSNFSAWLFTIMRNTFINSYRAQSRRRKVLVVEEEFTPEQLQTHVAKNQGELKFLNKDIEKALDHLSDHLRSLFIAHFEGYKYQEIADAYNIPIGTVKTRIHHARIELKKYLKVYARE